MKFWIGTIFEGKSFKSCFCHRPLPCLRLFTSEDQLFTSFLDLGCQDYSKYQAISEGMKYPLAIIEEFSLSFGVAVEQRPW